MPNILVVTTATVANREIEHSLGAVLGVSVKWGGTSQDRVSKAIKDASSQILTQAGNAGADAIVGYQISIAGVRGFWGFSFAAQSAVVTISGTAVKLRP